MAGLVYRSRRFIAALVVLLLACSACGERRGPLVSPANEAVRQAALAEIAALELPADADAKQWQELKDELARELSQVQIVFGPPIHPRSRVTDISVSPLGTGLLLDWAYTNNGDYDQNSEVNAADLVPMAPALYRRAGDALWARWRLADGDMNAEVNPADIAPIGGNFRRTVAGYEVQFRSADPDGEYTPLTQLPFSSSAIPAGEFGRPFTYTLTDAPVGWYRVVPYFQGELGIPSIPVRFDPGPNAPPSAAIEADTPLGPTPLLVTFDASASFDPDGTIVLYEWDLDGDGSYELNTVQPTAQKLYPAVGAFDIGVRVTDDRGAQAQAHTCIGALDWRFHQVTEPAGGFAGAAAQLVENRPVGSVSEFLQPSGGHAWFYTAGTSHPAGPADWSRHEIMTSAHRVSGGWGHLTQIQGRHYAFLAEVRASQQNTYFLATSNSPLPGSTADWTYCELSTFTPPGPVPSWDLFELNGRPALAHGEGKSVQLWVANVDVPLTQADWTISEIEVAPPGPGEPRPLGAVVDGKPVLVYHSSGIHELRYAYSQVELPQTSADWTVCVFKTLPVPIGTSGYGMGPYAVAEITGKPIVLFFQNVDSVASTMFATALTATPLTEADWALDELPTVQLNTSAIVEFDGRPLVIGPTFGGFELWMLLGCRPDPRTKSDWIFAEFDHPRAGSETVPGGFQLSTGPGWIGGAFADNGLAPVIFGYCPTP